MIKKLAVVSILLCTKAIFAANFSQGSQISLYLPELYLPEQYLQEQDPQGRYVYDEKVSNLNIADRFIFESSFAHYDSGLSNHAQNRHQDLLPRYLTISEEKDWQYLKAQTYTLIGSGVALAGLMTLLPESTTGWNSDSRHWDSVESKWKDNVTAGPQWDKDDAYLNYILHPYFGGIYYTASRHAGYDPYESTLYSFAMSTFFWEYGIEAVAERPSYQDLIITPIFGAIVGEAMLFQEQAILANGGEVWGSRILGNISLFFLNPIGHIHHWITDSWGKDTDLNFNLSYTPQAMNLYIELKF